MPAYESRHQSAFTSIVSFAGSRFQGQRHFDYPSVESLTILPLSSHHPADAIIYEHRDFMAADEWDEEMFQIPFAAEPAGRFCRSFSCGLNFTLLQWWTWPDLLFGREIYYPVPACRAVYCKLETLENVTKQSHLLRFCAGSLSFRPSWFFHHSVQFHWAQQWLNSSTLLWSYRLGFCHCEWSAWQHFGPLLTFYSEHKMIQVEKILDLRRQVWFFRVGHVWRLLCD